MRQEFPANVRLAAWERCKGHCETCGQKILGRAEFDHVLPDWLGGEPTLENASCKCSKCHRLKTSTSDVPRIAKTKRTRAKTSGVKRTKNPLPGSRGTKWKKTFNNGVVER